MPFIAAGEVNILFGADLLDGNVQHGLASHGHGCAGVFQSLDNTGGHPFSNVRLRLDLSPGLADTLNVSLAKSLIGADVRDADIGNGGALREPAIVVRPNHRFVLQRNRHRFDGHR